MKMKSSIVGAIALVPVLLILIATERLYIAYSDCVDANLTIKMQAVR